MSKKKTEKKQKKKANTDIDSKFSYDNYILNKLYVYHIEYNDEEDKYEYIIIEILKDKWLGPHFSLPRGINPTVNNLSNITFPDSLLHNFLFDLMLIYYFIFYSFHGYREWIRTDPILTLYGSRK